MSKITTYSAITGGVIQDPSVWSADCSKYLVNDTQGIRARPMMMVGAIDPRWPFASCDGTIETQGPSTGTTATIASVSESGILGPDSQIRFGKISDPDNSSKSALICVRKQGDESSLLRTEMSFSPTLAPIPQAPASVWVACAYRLPSSWKTASANDEAVIFQIQASPDGGDEAQPPPIGMVVGGNGYQRMWVRNNPNATTTVATTTSKDVLYESSYFADRWQYLIVKIRSHWDNSYSPRLEVWRALDNGSLKKIVDHSGPNSYNNTVRDFAKHGLYYFSNLWTGGITNRTMYSKGLYQWLDSSNMTPELILDHLRTV